MSLFMPDIPIMCSDWYILLYRCQEVEWQVVEMKTFRSLFSKSVNKYYQCSGTWIYVCGMRQIVSVDKKKAKVDQRSIIIIRKCLWPNIVQAYVSLSTFVLFSMILSFTWIPLLCRHLINTEHFLFLVVKNDKRRWDAVGRNQWKGARAFVYK